MSGSEAFTATLGGTMIGVAAVLLLWLNGRVAGISGILYGVFTRQPAERNWRLMFLAGLVLGGVLYQVLTNELLISRSGYPVWLVVAAGFLVGIGTRLGSGCTSGHGVCGISRMSVRSLIATLTFVAAGMLTASTLQTLLGTSP